MENNSECVLINVLSYIPSALHVNFVTCNLTQ